MELRGHASAWKIKTHRDRKIGRQVQCAFVHRSSSTHTRAEDSSGFFFLQDQYKVCRVLASPRNYNLFFIS